MENTEKTYWQLAAGSDGRDYTDAFLRHGLAFVGGPNQIETMNEIREGDRIVLKEGLSKIKAVGKVVSRDGRCTGNGDKIWLRDFDGWDLPAYCYVEWHVPKSSQEAQGLIVGTIMRISPARQHLREIAERILVGEPALIDFAVDPPRTRKVEDPDILAFLIREGLRPSAAEELTTAFRRIRLLARYYYDECKPEDVREHD